MTERGPASDELMSDHDRGSVTSSLVIGSAGAGTAVVAPADGGNPRRVRVGTDGVALELELP